MNFLGIRRPERLREAKRAEDSKPVMSGPDETEQAQLEAQQVRQMLLTPGWKLVQAALNAKCLRLWDEIRDPLLTKERREQKIMEAIKYSGIQDVIEDILNKKG